MPDFNIGDIVIRKSYGGDIDFKVIDVKAVNGRKSPHYILQGLFHRIIADSDGSDLVLQDKKVANHRFQRHCYNAQRLSEMTGMRCRYPLYLRAASRPGKILHIDSSENYLEKCLQHYRKKNLDSIGQLVPESEQPYAAASLIKTYHPDIVIFTGHDSLKKEKDANSLSSYRNSRYYIDSVKEARKVEPDFNKLCIFAGACQSYYEGIMNAGANFASSPGRILINALDPALVSERIALTDYRRIVTAREVAGITISGKDGIGGIDTYGRLKWI